jgi:hypothetical protein
MTWWPKASMTSLSRLSNGSQEGGNLTCGTVELKPVARVPWPIRLSDVSYPRVDGRISNGHQGQSARGDAGLNAVKRDAHSCQGHITDRPSGRNKRCPQPHAARQPRFDDNPLALAFIASRRLVHQYPSTGPPRSVAATRKGRGSRARNETATQPTVRRATASSITVEANFRRPSSSSGATGCGTATAG